MNTIKLKPKQPYDEHMLPGPMVYAIQSRATNYVVAILYHKDMAYELVRLLNDRKISYFTDGYEVREVYDE